MNEISSNRDIVEPVEFLRYLNNGIVRDISFVKCVIFLYDKSLVRFIRRKFSSVKRTGFTSDCYLIHDRILICYGFGIGSPAAVAAMEELISAGAKNFISIGTAGGISPGIELGDIVVCSKALIDEGTSAQYIPKHRFSFPDGNLTKELFRLLQNNLDNTSIGITCTTDAPFRETTNKLILLLEKDINVIEMEASALFTIGQYRNVKVASAFVIGDRLSKEGWVPGFLEKIVQYRCRCLANVIIKYYLI